MVVGGGGPLTSQILCTHRELFIGNFIITSLETFGVLKLRQYNESTVLLIILHLFSWNWNWN